MPFSSLAQSLKSASYLLLIISLFNLFPKLVSASDSTLASSKLNQQKYLIVVALPEEIAGSNITDFAPIAYTGVGKVNAAIKLYEAIQKHKPDLVINFGTAGTLKNAKGIFHVDTFVQTDMDARALGLARGITPDSKDTLPVQKGIVLGTSDSFIVDPKKQLDGITLDIDLVDMEAFALREVCKHLNVKFESYKYVSDSADQEASEDWQKNANNGAVAFIKVLTEQYGKSTLKASHSIK
jgi:adenosylhomocysteine nucleosidase